jgi:putative peptidoglycan lipid II flippase
MIGRLVSVGGFTALSRVAGFIRDVLMAAVLGAGPQSDAFMVAFRLPNNFRALFAEGAFSAAFLPRFAARAATGGFTRSSPAARFANEVFAWQFAAQLVLLLLALIFMRRIIGVLAPGFSDNPDQQALAVELARITFPYLFFIAIVAQLSSMLNAADKFRAAAAASIFLNLSMIAALSLAQFFPTAAHAVAYGVLIAGAVELLFIVHAAARTGLALRLKLPRWNAEMRDFTSALGAAMVGAGSVEIGLFIDTLIASFLPAGDLTSLYYADRINQLPMGIVGVAIGTVLLPEMSAKLARNDEKGASIAQNRAVVLGLLLTLPCIAAFFIIPDLLMRALFVRGIFTVEAADQAAAALSAYAVGLPAFVLLRCVVPSFYARGDTATPVRATITAVAANIALKFLFVMGLDLGVFGLALGTSLGAWTNLAVLSYLARRRAVLVATPELKRGIVPVFVAAIAAGAGFFAGDALGQSLLAPSGGFRELIAFFIAGSSGAAAFALVVLSFRRNLPLGAR